MLASPGQALLTTHTTEGLGPSPAYTVDVEYSMGREAVPTLNEVTVGAQVVVAIITGFAALFVALVSVPLNYWISRRTKREQTQDAMARYRDPLLWAVHDLRSRIFTILNDDFLGRHILKGSDDALRRYARRHTAYTIAEYLGWVEVVRRSLGFLDLGDHKRNQRLVEHLSIIRWDLFAIDLSPMMHVTLGYQRAIGELMIVSDHEREGRGWRCIGFAEFCRNLDDDSRFASWFERLEKSIDEFAENPETNDDRLIQLSGHLTELIDFLDPSGVRFPLRDQERARSRLPTGNAQRPEELPKAYRRIV